ncbi:hypothetical protein C8Q80DRAFT_1120043 [Daedaleopsis nitida]|nr:hypothetical protein C8Q80DRAFT_1120043 [Daedaleopsis nitida]
MSPAPDPQESCSAQIPSSEHDLDEIVGLSNAGHPGWPAQGPTPGQWYRLPPGASVQPDLSTMLFVSYLPVTYIIPLYVMAPTHLSSSQVTNDRETAGPICMTFSGCLPMRDKKKKHNGKANCNKVSHDKD